MITLDRFNLLAFMNKARSTRTPIRNTRVTLECFVLTLKAELSHKNLRDRLMRSESIQSVRKRRKIWSLGCD